jgi:hypothetical protein
LIIGNDCRLLAHHVSSYTEMRRQDASGKA